MTTLTDVEVREGSYGDKVIAVEPGGAEFIPLSERHGRPLQLFWTWTSPNMEFATIFVGFLGVWAFGMSFWSTVLAIVLGTGLGAITQGLLSTQGPRFGVPQMVLSRLGFGYWGNALPAGINSVIGRYRLVRGEQRERHARAEQPHPHARGALPADHRGGPDRGGVPRPQPDPRVRAVRLPGAGDHLPDRVRLDAVQGPPGRQALDDSRRLPDRARRDVRLRGGLEPLRLGLHALPQAGNQQAGHRPVGRPRPVPLLRPARDRRRGRGDDPERGRVAPGPTRRPPSSACSPPGWAT